MGNMITLDIRNIKVTCSVFAVATYLCLVLMGSAAFANSDDDGFVMKNNGKRFFALPVSGSTQSNLMGVRVVRPVPKTSLKSDATALRNGFMRVDRDILTITRPMSTKHAKPEVKDTPNTDAVTLSLFDTEIKRKNEISGKTTHNWPLPASVSQHISSGYGMRNDPFHGERRFHGGLDIAAAQGTSVLATATGRVKAVGFLKGYGNSVTLSHPDGSETMYSHLQKALARVGSMVRSGQEIGKLGSTGRSTGPHLDYRLKVAGQKRDPMTVLASAKPAGIGTAQYQVASRVRSSIATTSVRNEKGVRIITPRERIAMSGGFIQVR